MKTESKIIRLFIGNKKQRTIREIAKCIKSDYRITYIAVQRLINKKILISQTVGNSTLCKLNDLYYGVEIYDAENKKREELLRNKNIMQLYKELMNKIKTSFFMLIVFGSFAKKIQNKTSDIDLIFVSNEKNFEEKIHSIISLIPIKIHALVFTEEEFIRMKDSKELNVVKEVINSNIILYGIENYYRLKNV